VPLIFAGFNIKSSKIVSQQVGLVDVFPTIVGLIGLENLNSNLDGTSLIPLFTNQHLDEKPLFIQSMPHIAENHKNYVGIRTSEFKYVRDDNNENFELFDLNNDPLEQYDVSNDFPEIVTKMENILQDYLNQKIKSDTKKLDDEERKKVEEELKKLGYI
jgi:arylsulfatase